jgi:hypothetical protein
MNGRKNLIVATILAALFLALWWTTPKKAPMPPTTNPECKDFIMPTPTTSMGDHCPRSDQRAEVTGGFVVCHCTTNVVVTADGGL